MKKGHYLLIAVFVVLIVLVVVPVPVNPPGDTRVILEHTHKFYVTPVCFEEADVTNNLGESTLTKAKELNYPPDSDCTVESLQSESMSIWNALLVKVGLGSHKWSW